MTQFEWDEISQEITRTMPLYPDCNGDEACELKQRIHELERALRGFRRWDDELVALLDDTIPNWRNEGGKQYHSRNLTDGVRYAFLLLKLKDRP